MKALQPAGKISDVFDFLKRENRPSLSIEEIIYASECAA